MNSKSLEVNKHVKLDCWINENATINDYQVKVCAMVCHAKISPTQKWSWTDFCCHNWSPWATLVAKNGPFLSKLVLLGQSPGAGKSGSPDQFGLLQMVLLPYSDC